MLFLALFVTNTPPKRVIREDVRVIRDGSSHTPERLSTPSQLPLSLSLSLSASRPRPPHSGRVESAVHRCGRRCGRRCGARQSAGARVRGMAALHALRNQLARVLHAAGQRLPLLLKHLELVAEQNLLIAKLCVRNRTKQKRRKYTCSRWLLCDRFSLCRASMDVRWAAMVCWRFTSSSRIESLADCRDCSSLDSRCFWVWREERVLTSAWRCCWRC